MVADFGFWAATIPARNSRINTITDTITIPVQAGITAAVLMVVADMADIEPRTTRTTRTRIDAASPSGKSLCQ